MAPQHLANATETARKVEVSPVAIMGLEGKNYMPGVFKPLLRLIYLAP